MIVFTHTITPRLRYITAFIGKEVTGEAFRLTTDLEEFKKYEGPKINYSDKRISYAECWIRPHTLLSETEITAQAIECFQNGDHKAFFRTEGDVPFDIFAASFYLLSRYEEYLPHKEDMYGRYSHENSLAFKEGFLDMPLVNQWIQFFIKRLNDEGPLLESQNSSFRFIPTYDIDEAFSYKHKGWWRTIGAIGKALLKGNWSGIGERRKVLNNKLRDPFDAYEWMDQLHLRFHLAPRYFFLVPDRTGKYDRNILPREPALHELIKRHDGKYDIGVHPSWQSGDNPFLIEKEKSTIEKITGKRVSASRQHFIRFDLPTTFQCLIDAGICEDFSMGYGTVNGFRASVASPFYWFDLDTNTETGLLLYPFCFMEANSFFEQKISPQKALEEIKSYYEKVKAVNGTFICIWHNTFLGTEKLYAGWREVYEQFLETVTPTLGNSK